MPPEHQNSRRQGGANPHGCGAGFSDGQGLRMRMRIGLARLPLPRSPTIGRMAGILGDSQFFQLWTPPRPIFASLS